MDTENYIQRMQEIRDGIEFKIGKKLTAKQWGAISYQAYEDGHYAGMSEIVSKAKDLTELVIDLLKE